MKRSRVRGVAGRNILGVSFSSFLFFLSSGLCRSGKIDDMKGPRAAVEGGIEWGGGVRQLPAPRRLIMVAVQPHSHLHLHSHLYSSSSFQRQCISHKKARTIESCMTAVSGVRKKKFGGLCTQAAGEMGRRGLEANAGPERKA